MLFEPFKVMLDLLYLIDQPSSSNVPDLNCIRLGIQGTQITRELTWTHVFVYFTISQQVLQFLRTQCIICWSVWSFLSLWVWVVHNTLGYKAIFEIKSSFAIMLVAIQIWKYTHDIAWYKSAKFIINRIILDQIVKHWLVLEYFIAQFLLHLPGQVHKINWIILRFVIDLVSILQTILLFKNLIAKIKLVFNTSN